MHIVQSAVFLSAWFMAKQLAIIPTSQQLLSLLRRLFFYVGNLSVDCTTDALQSFVSNMNITAISCFDVRPRRRFAEESDERLKSRKGFRLCTWDKDRERLLNDSVWPEYVTVIEWFSKPRRAENVRQVHGGFTTSQ